MKDNLPDRIKLARKSAGYTQKDLAKRLKIALPTYNKYEKGKRVPTADTLNQMAKETGCDPGWLLAGGIESADAIHEAPAHYGAHDEFVYVPRYEVQASAGHGEIIHSEQVVDVLSFKKEWVTRDLGVDPKNLILITALGDSMEPTIHAGDLLLLDMSIDRIKDDSLYVIAIDEALLVKRVQKMVDGKVRIKSDNPAYQEQIINKSDLDQLRIVGRVIRILRRV